MHQIHHGILSKHHLLPIYPVCLFLSFENIVTHICIHISVFSFHTHIACFLTQAEEARVERKLEEVGELHARELKREREAWAAAEKIRREQWMAKVYDLWTAANSLFIF